METGYTNQGQFATRKRLRRGVFASLFQVQKTVHTRHGWRHSQGMSVGPSLLPEDNIQSTTDSKQNTETCMVLAVYDNIAIACVRHHVLPCRH
jgi:hypothetical protein